MTRMAAISRACDIFAQVLTVTRRAPFVMTEPPDQEYAEPHRSRLAAQRDPPQTVRVRSTFETCRRSASLTSRGRWSDSLRTSTAS